MSSALSEDAIAVCYVLVAGFVGLIGTLSAVFGGPGDWMALPLTVLVVLMGKDWLALHRSEDSTSDDAKNSSEVTRV